MLPKECVIYNALNEANQNIFRIQLKRKNHPPKFKTIMKKNLLVWAAAKAAGRAAGRDLITSLEQGSSFVQQTQPRGIFRFFRQNAPARTEGEAGVFVGQVAVRRCKATHKNKFLYSDLSKVPLGGTKQPVFNPTLYGRCINR